MFDVWVSRVIVSYPVFGKLLPCRFSACERFASGLALQPLSLSFYLEVGRVAG